MTSVLIGGITSSPNVGSPNSSLNDGVNPSPDFDINDLFANGEKGGLFIYNQNVFKDIEGYYPSDSEVSLICNSLGESRRNLYNFSELETGLSTESTNQMNATETQFSEGVSGALISNKPGMSAGYVYLKTKIKADQQYNISCEMYGQDGTYSPLGEGNSAQITFGSRTKMGGLKNLHTEDLGDNHYRISASFTGQIDEESFFGVGKFVNSKTTPTVVSKFQIEEGAEPTKYQHVGTYGAWGGLALYTTGEKSILENGCLLNNGLIFNDLSNLENSTVIRFNNGLIEVAKNRNLTQEVIINDDFSKLLIVNRELTIDEISNAIKYLGA